MNVSLLDGSSAAAASAANPDIWRFHSPFHWAVGQRLRRASRPPQTPTPRRVHWLSIKADETVTLLIGKVELGQGNVTAWCRSVLTSLPLTARLKSFPATPLVPE